MSDKTVKPAPTPGLVANVDQLINSNIEFQAIIGSYTEDDVPQAPDTPALPTMSLHYWHLKQDVEDNQSPHFQDELYMVLTGEGKFKLEGEPAFDVGPGDVIFVPALKAHHFERQKSDMKILVFFAPDWDGQPVLGSGKP